MQVFALRLTLLVFIFCSATSALVADEPGANKGASPMVWITLLAPTFVIIFFIYIILRNARGNQETVAKKVEKSEETFRQHREYTEDHMRHLETQVDQVAERLDRVIALLEAIEQGQRRGPV